VAEVDGNRTRQRQILPLNGVEDRAGHQAGYTSPCHAPILARRCSIGGMTRLTQYARGGGCACKIPPGELERMVAGLPAAHHPDLLVGVENGDDAAVLRMPSGPALVLTTDFFTPVVDDAYDWGRIAAANALSDVYAMGGTPVLAVNLLAWPRDTLPMELAGEVLRGGAAVAAEAGCLLAGGHSIDDADPKYGLAVTGLVDPQRLLRNDAGRPGLPLSLTKPLGTGVLNSRHKATGERFDEAVRSMTTLNREASAAAVAAGVRCATDVTGFGLLGHALKLARASGVTAVIDAAAVPYLDGAREAARDGYVSGGTRRNLEWVSQDAELAAVDELTALLLADAQTSGGLLVAGELPGAPVVGRLVARRDTALIVTARS
jgi:selenide, water dikinase